MSEQEKIQYRVTVTGYCQYDAEYFVDATSLEDAIHQLINDDNREFNREGFFASPEFLYEATEEKGEVLWGVAEWEEGKSASAAFESNGNCSYGEDGEIILDLTGRGDDD
jgi:hypothetical protein